MWKGKSCPHQGVRLSAQKTSRRASQIRSQQHSGLRAEEEPERVTQSLSSNVFQSGQRDNKYAEKNSTRWVHSGLHKKIPRRWTSLLTLEWGVETGRTERKFQVEEDIVNKCRKFTERKTQVWPHRRESNTDWVLKSLDTNQWAVRLFSTSAWVYFYVKEDEQDHVLTGVGFPELRILKFSSCLYLPLSFLPELPQGLFNWRQHPTIEHLIHVEHVASSLWLGGTSGFYGCGRRGEYKTSSFVQRRIYLD